MGTGSNIIAQHFGPGRQADVCSSAASSVRPGGVAGPAVTLLCTLPAPAGKPAPVLRPGGPVTLQNIGSKQSLFLCGKIKIFLFNCDRIWYH